MDINGAKDIIKAAMVVNLTVTDAATARDNFATALTSAMALLITTSQIEVTTGLANSGGPVTGVIPAGSIG